jgi:hypothetical protein
VIFLNNTFSPTILQLTHDLKKFKSVTWSTDQSPIDTLVAWSAASAPIGHRLADLPPVGRH